jgi:hypothetical protein
MVVQYFICSEVYGMIERRRIGVYSQFDLLVSKHANELGRTHCS